LPSDFVDHIRIQQSKGIGHAVEEREQRGDVNRFGNLFVRPANFSQLLGALCGGLVGMTR